MSADAETVFVRPDPTPGPWKACGTIYEHMNAEIRSGAKGEGVAIAQVWEADNAFSNALLIATAPELLDALNHALELRGLLYEAWFSSPQDDSSANSAQVEAEAVEQIIRAAIAKATGESQ